MPNARGCQETTEQPDTQGCASDLFYGEVLRDILLQESRKNGGSGDLKVTILSKDDTSEKIIIVLFCNASGGIVSDKNSREFVVARQWICKNKEPDDGDIFIYGDLCVLSRKQKLTRDLARLDGKTLFRTLNGSRKAGPVVSNLIG